MTPTKTRGPFTVPFDEATTPREGNLWCRTNRWWVVHPEDGVMFYGVKGRLADASPLCNSDEVIVQYLQQKHYPDCEVRFIPVVYQPGHGL